MRVLCTCGLLLALLQLGSSLLLGAFNIQSFGDKKASNPTLMDIISTIVHRYDIILIQEVRDSDLSATKILMDRVNKAVPGQYSYTVSEPLGRSTYKERYLFLYRADTVSVVKKYTYDDSTDVFNREPFVIMFSRNSGGNFVLIPQHTSPKSAIKEVDALYDVVTDVRYRWKTNDILLLGDFNAACSYVSAKDWVKIRLFTDKSFHWLIPNDVDTTVADSNCAYDRIVATTDMMKQVVHGSAAVFNYKKYLHLSHSLALAVSDHYPVEVRLTDTIPSS